MTLRDRLYKFACDPWRVCGALCMFFGAANAVVWAWVAGGG